MATREAYVRCERLSPVTGHLDWIKVIRAVDERISVAGGDEELVDSKAVTFELKLSRPSTAAFAVTVHAAAVDGHWRWILTPRRFQIYRSGTCPKAEESPASSA